MTYYNSKKNEETNFENAIEKVTKALKDEGFDVLTEIDVKSTFKKKLDVDFRNSRILGACNPPYAYKALQMEKYIGVLLPCNVEVQQEHNGGDIEVTIVSPMETMMALENEQLAETALEITNKLNTVLNNL